MSIVRVIKNLLRPFYTPIVKKYITHKECSQKRKQIGILSTIPQTDRKNIFYLGITAHSNLGDMAQYYCIHNWIVENYPNSNIYEFEASVVVDKQFDFVDKLKTILKKKDIIVFQSGYTTQDLGGFHDLMHRLVIDAIPSANILMMPQTIFFKFEENKQRTAKSYNKAHNMLFLARDCISFQTAQEMFPDLTIKTFPDIVTTLIGHFNFKYERKGILMCCRNDSEKYYSEEEIASLKSSLESLEPITITDTNSKVSYKRLRKNPKIFIESTINEYSKYKLIITDRYHGTIFSLAANTPVIVIKTTDHKVTTGVDWFKGIYDDYVFKANSLEDVYNIIMKVLKTDYNYRLNSYFDTHYYDILKEIFENAIVND